MHPTVVLYQRFPVNTLLRMLLPAATVVAAALWALLVVSSPLLTGLAEAALLLSGFIFVGVATMSLLGIARLGQPMLRFTPDYLGYRQLNIPWPLIESVSARKVRGASFVALQIHDISLALRGLPSYAAQFWRGQSARAGGCILIPGARDMSIGELCAAIEKARSDHLGGAIQNTGCEPLQHVPPSTSTTAFTLASATFLAGASYQAFLALMSYKHGHVEVLWPGLLKSFAESLWVYVIIYIVLTVVRRKDPQFDLWDKMFPSFR